MTADRLLAIDVSHGAIHDGPGMRTTVFVKGCSLHCLWCQNPESISRRNDVWWDATQCIGCRLCEKACARNAIRLEESGMVFDRGACIACGSCAKACPTSAMAQEAQEYTMEKLLREVLRDRYYYQQFGGGVTVSGGEPLLQHEFVAEFFRRLKEQDVSTALDTCGCAQWQALEAVLPYTGYVLYDMKILDSEKHLAYTGAGNGVILSNLLSTAEYMRSAEREIHLWIRTPLIPEVTATFENIKAIAEFIRDNLADVVERWELCAFNGACVSKYKKLGEKWEFSGVPLMTAPEAKKLRDTVLGTGLPESLISVSGLLR